jgi:hypothetical protein
MTFLFFAGASVGCFLAPEMARALFDLTEVDLSGRVGVAAAVIVVEGLNLFHQR